MTRFDGIIGYGTQVEAVAGVWIDQVVETRYQGTVLDQVQTQVQTDKVNNSLRSSERISIMADAYLSENWTKIKYVVRAGSLWTVSSVEVKRPRLILTLGGVYDGPVPEPTP